MFNSVERAKELARKHGMTPAELCRRSDLSPNTFYGAASRGSQLKLDSIILICEALKITLQEFFAV